MSTQTASTEASSQFSINPLNVGAMLVSLAILGIFVVVTIVLNFHKSKWLTASSADAPKKGFYRWFHRYYKSIYGHGIDEAESGVFTLIEAVKTVSVFLLTLTPDTMRVYKCATPLIFLGLDDSPTQNDPFFETKDILLCDRDDTTYGTNFVENSMSADGFNFTTQQSAYMESICNINYLVDYWLILMFFLELVTLFYFFLWRDLLFDRARAHSIIFFITSFLWGVWNYFFVIEITSIDPKIYCQVRFAFVIAVLFSLIHGAIGFALWLGWIAFQEDEKTREANGDGKEIMESDTKPPVDGFGFETGEQ